MRQWGSILFRTGETIRTATISTIDPIASQLTLLEPTDGRIHIALTNATTVTAKRTTSEGDEVVRFLIREFTPAPQRTSWLRRLMDRFSDMTPAQEFLAVVCLAFGCYVLMVLWMAL